MDESTKRISKSYATMLKDLGLARVDYLKIDVETYEWTVIPALLQHGIAKELPRQSALEMHLLATTESPQQPKCTLRLKPGNQAK